MAATHQNVPVIKRVDARHIKHHVEQAISRRRCSPAEGLISVQRDPAHPASVLVHVNSGGNAAAAVHALTQRGYRVERTNTEAHAGEDYGVRLHVCASNQ